MADQSFGHAEGCACLSEEQHAERRVHHDMGMIHKKMDSCDNCHHGDFSVAPRYMLMFTVSNKEICTCKLVKVKSRQVHDQVTFFTLCCQECERRLE